MAASTPCATFSRLCGRCSSLEEQFFRPAPTFYEADARCVIFHHLSYDNLIASAAGACELCVLFIYGLHDAYRRDHQLKLTSPEEVTSKLLQEDGVYREIGHQGRRIPKALERLGQFRLEMLSDWYHTEFSRITGTGTRTGTASMCLTREWGDLSSPSASFILATEPTEVDYLADSRRLVSLNRQTPQPIGGSPSGTPSGTPPPLGPMTRPIGDMAFLEGRFYGREMQQEPDLILSKQWIDECREWHKCQESCGGQANPARLIHIKLTASSVPVLRLIGVEKAPPDAYVCLSHRWSLDLRCKTTKNTYADHLERIDFEGLPKTFRDAVRITSALGYSFLWIDSLCIIQDDSADWESECPKMGGIYAGGAVTIASPGAKDSDAGLISPRGPIDAVNPCTVRYRDRAGLTKGSVRISYAGLKDGMWAYCYPDRHSVLEDRGWILQERVLSSRVLYFGLRQLYFECNSCQHFEMVHYPIHISRNERDENFYKEALSGGGSPDELFVMWYKMLENFTLRKLTDPMDKLSAISGIAKIIRDATSSDYLGGIWREDLARGLIWYSHHDHFRADLGLVDAILPYRAPSWSWARSDCGATVARQQIDRGGSNLLLEVISAEMKLCGKDTFGLVSDGRLRVRGKAKKGIIRRGPKVSYMSDLALCDPDSSHGEIVAPFLPDHPHFLERLRGGLDQGQNARVEVLTLLTSQLRDITGERKQTFGLVLMPSGTNAIYTRVGIFREDRYRDLSYISAIEKWFQDAGELGVEII